MGGGMEAARRTLLAYQRSEEQAADQAAVRFLTATGQSPMGMINTFRRFQDSAMFRTTSLDPYLMSHPLPAERIAQLERLAEQSPYRTRRDPPELQARHDLARAKLFGFVERPETVLRRYPPSDNSLASRYARAVVMHRSGRMNDSLALIDSLIQAQPRNTYFHELRGQVLLESARPRDAAASLRQAVALNSDAATIRTLYAQALLALGDAASLSEATSQLQNATRREPENPEAHRHLAMAHGRAGNIALAELAMANSYFHAGDFTNARTQAHRAMSKLPAGSAEHRRAEAIFSFVPQRN
jgi:predicted Zn-dependent protease